MFGLFKKKPQRPKFDRAMVVPRIKTTQFLEAIKAAGVPPEQEPYTEPLVADLVVTYAFDLPDTFVMATPPFLKEAGIDNASLRDLAIGNLKRQIPRISLQQSGSVYRAVTGNNVDACTLLAPSMWSDQAAKMQGELIASVPNRDLVLFCDSASPDGLREMKEMIPQAFEAGGNHALTQALLKWCGDHWEEYRE